ncbi:FG-GAP repeat [Pycnococcus provasolii]
MTAMMTLALTNFATVVRAQGGGGMAFQQVQKVFASDDESGDNFGHALQVSQDGLTMVVGAHSESTGGSWAGAAYVFTRGVPSGNWTEVVKLQASDKRHNDYFGESVSTSADGSTVVVGASGEDTGGSSAGAAYVFTRGGGAGGGTNYTEVAKLQASDKQAGDLFGASVSTSADGSTVVVAASGEDTGGSRAGATYVFTRGGGGGSSINYTEVAKLQASDKQANDFFGSSELTYVFTRGGGTGGSSYTEVAKLQASDKQANDYFGWSVSTSADGSTVVVGARWESTGGQFAGAAYVFTRGVPSGNWTEVVKLQASDKQAYDYFGESVSTSADGSTVVVGVSGESTGGRYAGAAYVFTRRGGAGSGSYTEVAKLQAGDKQANDYFGRSVSISGDGRTIAAGANGGDGYAAGASMLEGLDPNSEEYKEMSEMLNATGMLAVPTKAPPSSSDNPGTKARDSGAAYIFAAPPLPTTTTTTTTTSPPRFPPVPPLGELPDPPPSGAFPPGVPSNAPTLTGLSVAIGISTLLVCYNFASS